jgi:hypothetical protein
VAAGTGGLRVLELFDFAVKLITAVRVMIFTTDRTGTHFLVDLIAEVSSIFKIEVTYR